ncbi:MAG: HEAT repeat domain-containing protein [Phycisphaerales bacterium]|nr:MAG: HEAT repeat domain-containing protein [Phycisphaerales bacterium]
MNRVRCWPVGMTIIGIFGGCVQPVATGTRVSYPQLNSRAVQRIKTAIGSDPNPAVRVEAVEALESLGDEEAGPWIRSALLDVHPAVRFAACVAVGKTGDAKAESAVHERLGDENGSVRVAALFALHRLGHTEKTGWMPTYLLEHDDPTVRRNAALVMGFMGDPGVIKMLARAMRDSDAGVRNHALEAMARLGNREARQELAFMTSAGIGAEEVFAIQALAQTREAAYMDTFRYKLANAPHMETRLAAAHGLGLLGSDEGLDVALRALATHRAVIDDPNDPPDKQALRIRQLAAGALGAIGRAEALPQLSEMMDRSEDPRLQVSAAKAVVKILGTNRKHGSPFLETRSVRKR